MAGVSASSSSHTHTRSDPSLGSSLQTVTGLNATEEGTTEMADTGDGTTAGTETGGDRTSRAVARTKAFRLGLVRNETRLLHQAPHMIGPCPHHLCLPEVPMAMVIALGA